MNRAAVLATAVQVLYSLLDCVSKRPHDTNRLERGGQCEAESRQRARAGSRYRTSRVEQGECDETRNLEEFGSCAGGQRGTLGKRGHPARKRGLLDLRLVLDRIAVDGLLRPRYGTGVDRLHPARR